MFISFFLKYLITVLFFHVGKEKKKKVIESMQLFTDMTEGTISKAAVDGTLRSDLRTLFPPAN
jgi:hypothetical protein